MKSLLMTPDNAQKCHDGTKTQTRRLIKPQPDSIYHSPIHLPGTNGWAWHKPNQGTIPFIRECPFSVGEQVYIKEKYCHKADPITAIVSDTEFWYFAVNPDVIKVDGDGGIELTKAGYEASPWLSSRFMPERAARTVVTITGVGAQRVQDISEDDAIAEGIIRYPPKIIQGLVYRALADYSYNAYPLQWGFKKGERLKADYPSLGLARLYSLDNPSGQCIHLSRREAFTLLEDESMSYKIAFSYLWDSIHGPDAWERNDFVWKYSFIRRGYETTD